MKTLRSIERLTDALHRLPGIGLRSAERLAYAIVEMKDEDSTEIVTAIKEAKEKIGHCPVCGLYSEGGRCAICEDEGRRQDELIVVSWPRDVYAFERLGTYDGLYHVLGGVISPLKGVGVDDLSISSLLDRIDKKKIKEIIIATDPTTEGETTALYIRRLLEEKDVAVFRLAYGMPAGGSLEYADALTLTKALEGKRKI